MEVRPGYKQTEVGVIPEEWAVVTFDDACRRLNGKAYQIQSSEYQRSGVVPIVDQGQKPVVGYTDRVDRVFKCPEDGVLVFGDHTCIVKFVNFDFVVGADGTQLIAAKPSQSTRFHAYALEHHGISSTGYSRHFKSLRERRFVSPPLPEQRAIAAALSDVDALLGGLDRLIAKKRDLKQAAMQQLLTGQIRLPGFHGKWEVKRLGDVIDYCFSGATPRRNRPEFYRGSIRWITSGELNYNVILDTVEKISADAVAQTNLAVVPAGTFLMAITGLEAEGTRGACAIVGAASTTNQSCMAVFPTTALVSQYLFHYYVLRGKLLALQYCQGTKQQSYTASLVKQLPIALPPSPEEQHAIAAILTDMDAELSALESRRDKTRALKQGMMQELLTGRTRLL